MIVASKPHLATIGIHLTFFCTVALLHMQLLVDFVVHQGLVMDQIQQRQLQQRQQDAWSNADTAAACSPGGSHSSKSADTHATIIISSNGMTQSKTPAPSPSTAAATAAQPAAAAAAHACISSAAGTGATAQAGSCGMQCSCCSYMSRLLRNATAEQMNWALTWTVEDWCNYWRVSRQHGSCSSTH
jgi:hypothetical protein